MKHLKRTIVPLSLLAYQLCFAGAASEPTVWGEWSEATNGLRGRLLLAEEARTERGMRRGVVYLELQNVALGDTMYVHYDPSKTPLRCDLSDSEGKAVPRSSAGVSSWMPSACWLALPHDSALRFLTGNVSTEPSESGLFIISAFTMGPWFIPAGSTNEYFLSGTFTATIPAGETRPRMWQGTLKLPKLKVPTRSP